MKSGLWYFNHGIKAEFFNRQKVLKQNLHILNLKWQSKTPKISRRLLKIFALTFSTNQVWKFPDFFIDNFYLLELEKKSTLGILSVFCNSILALGSPWPYAFLFPTFYQEMPKRHCIEQTMYDNGSLACHLIHTNS